MALSSTLIFRIPASRGNGLCNVRTRMQSASESRRLLEAARGYLTLGLYQHANGELERMSRETRLWPEVLAIKLSIFSALELWELVEIAAWQLTDCAGGNANWALLANSAKAATARHRSREAVPDRPHFAAA